MAVRAYRVKNYWRIILPVSRINIVKYRIQDPGRPGSNLRLAGQDKQGRWHTLGWRINIANVRVRGRTLVATNERTAKILNNIRKRNGAIIV